MICVSRLWYEVYGVSFQGWRCLTSLRICFLNLLLKFLLVSKFTECEVSILLEDQCSKICVYGF